MIKNFVMEVQFYEVPKLEKIFNFVDSQKILFGWPAFLNLLFLFTQSYILNKPILLFSKENIGFRLRSGSGFQLEDFRSGEK